MGRGFSDGSHNLLCSAPVLVVSIVQSSFARENFIDFK